MIKVEIKNSDNHLKYLTVKGHANYEEHGKDIVCASVSSMIILAINTIIAIDEKMITHQEKGDYINIEITNFSNDAINKVMNVLISMLKELESDYPKNIKIREEEI